MRIPVLALAFSALVLCPVAGLAQEGDANAGATVFKKCAACHVVDKDQNKVGPSLQGVIGRTAGTHPDFKYSQAMTEAGKGGLVWDEAALREYLQDPKAKVKGTKMAFPGLKKEDELSNVIAYLKQYSQ
ncbi:cytochrome c family protein [Ensifer sp. IC4062]|nr:cytochrome c family protein [Ensifer sp. IC4062]MCA1442578.1 cytochrome c family protein [Ensifer sp. IC4062]